jgi:uncharacterized protein (TIGR02444 family)
VRRPAGPDPPTFSTENPFWNFSLEIYARPGVSEACLALQDEIGADVNLVLFCLWLARQGRILDDAAARDCIAVTHPWQARMVAPIRALRQACRYDAMLAPEALRESLRQELARVELHAERVEHELLLAVDTSPAAARGASATAEGNIAGYFAAAGIVMNERAGELIGRILAGVT